MTPYYDEDGVTIFHGDCREVLPPTGFFAAIIADPPYAETNLAWDSWPHGWPHALLGRSRQMWCFGSLRMFLTQQEEFLTWSLGQEVIWEKHNGSGLHADRFRRVHESVVHWYQGPWTTLTLNPQTTPDATPRTVRKKARPAQWHGATGATVYTSQDGGPRLMRSVIYARSEHGHALHPTQKPVGLLEPLIAYSTDRGDTILDPFAGSGSALLAARLIGRRAVGCETDERYCEIAAKRLAQGMFNFDETRARVQA